MDSGTRRHDQDEVRGSMSNAWVHSGGRLILVGLRQLRPAAGEEQYVPSQQDWELLEELRTQFGQALSAHQDEVATPAVGTDEPEQDLTAGVLPDPLFIDGIGLPSHVDDLRLPQH
eukprot:687396-Amphidinium_carterae.1